MKRYLFLLFTLYQTNGTFGQAGNVLITGYTATDLTDNPDIIKDSLILLAWDNLYPVTKPVNLPHRRSAIRYPLPGGSYQFSMDNVHQPVYFTLGRYSCQQKKILPILKFYLAEPGDSIIIVAAGKNSMSFYGKGSPKYRCRKQLDEQTLFLRYEAFPCPDTSGQMEILNNYRQQLSPKIYAMMRADIAGLYSWKDSSRIIPKEQADENSYGYIKYLMAKQSAVKEVPDKKLQAIYCNIRDQYAGSLRDKLWITFFSDIGLNAIQVADMLTEAISLSTLSASKKTLNQLLINYTKGHEVYNFSLPNQKGDTIRLSDFKGKVVFMDFWFTGCTACRKYYTSIVAQAEKYFHTDPRVVFISINTDREAATWKRSLTDTTYRYTSEFAVNLYTAGQGPNHPVIQQYNVRSYPTPLVIDPSGKLFSRSSHELRGNDPNHLIETIKQALLKGP